MPNNARRWQPFFCYGKLEVKKKSAMVLLFLHSDCSVVKPRLVWTMFNFDRIRKQCRNPYTSRLLAFYANRLPILVLLLHIGSRATGPRSCSWGSYCTVVPGRPQNNQHGTSAALKTDVMQQKISATAKCFAVGQTAITKTN